VVRSKDIYDQLAESQSETHWLASLVTRRWGRKSRMIPVWQAFPYLLFGAGCWDLDMTGYGGVHERHGKIGAPGTVFRNITWREEQDGSTEAHNQILQSRAQ
jgi:hypothetical protein